MSSSPSSVAEPVQETAPGCRHHWVIDTPNGPTSSGVCRLCGARRDFRNYLDAPTWDDGPRTRLAKPEPLDPSIAALVQGLAEEQ